MENCYAMLSLSNNAKNDLLWWIENVNNQNINHIRYQRIVDHRNPDIVITTYASISGWGAICEGSSVGGRWNVDEKENNINYLDLLAIFIAVKSFCKQCLDIQCTCKDNDEQYMCYGIYVNNMGGIKSEKMNNLLKEIWFE